MMERYLDPTNDVAFKKIFMDEGKLRDFLNAMLRLPQGSRIQELVFLPQEEVPDLGQGKRSMFDIKCKDEKGNWFIIEMQNGKKSYFLKRVQFYASHTYVAQLKAGETHSDLMPVIVVVVVKEDLFPEDVACISYHKTREDKTNVQHLYALSYVFVELNKFKKRPEDLSSAEDYWLYFLANSPFEKSPPSTIDDPYVLKAYETIERFNWTQESYDAYIKARLLAEADEITARENKEKLEKSEAIGIAKGEAIGRARGEAIGIAKGEVIGIAKEKAKRLEAAKKLYAKGMSAKEIAEVMSLDVEEIS